MGRARAFHLGPRMSRELWQEQVIRIPASSSVRVAACFWSLQISGARNFRKTGHSRSGWIFLHSVPKDRLKCADRANLDLHDMQGEGRAVLHATVCRIKPSHAARFLACVRLRSTGGTAGHARSLPTVEPVERPHIQRDMVWRLVARSEPFLFRLRPSARRSIPSPWPRTSWPGHRPSGWTLPERRRFPRAWRPL